jgi:transcriptional regulator with XRE-family HTH domain
MSPSLGARLRHQREQQGIALASIAEQTKIKPSLLAALERDDVSDWPAGIFGRSFVRGYAKAIGLDGDAVVREFQTAHPQPDDINADAAARVAATADAKTVTGPPTRIGAMLRSAMAAFSQHRRGHEDGVEEPGGDTSTARSSGGSEVPTFGRPHAQPDPSDRADVPSVLSTRLNDPAPSDLDLLAVARLCTELGRIEHVDRMQPLLQEAARILDASGVIVWVWDEVERHLKPALAHGYSHRVLAQLPVVGRDADNPTATAFRSASVVALSDEGSGALVIPLLASTGCVGVLALELAPGREAVPAVRAVATIIAAMLAQLTGGASSAEMETESELPAPPTRVI